MSAWPADKGMTA